MKKAIFISCLLLTAKMGFSQIKIAAKAGINIASQQNAYYSSVTPGAYPTPLDGKSSLHLYAGFFTELLLSDNFLLRPQLMISGAGFKMGKVYDMNGNEIAGKRTYNLNYVTLPVQFLYSPRLSFGSLWIGTGPYAGLLVSGHYKSAGTKVSLSVGKDASDDFKGLDYGISSTIGIKFKHNWLFGIDQNTGFADVSNGNEKSRNRVWSFYVGYFIK